MNPRVYYGDWTAFGVIINLVTGTGIATLPYAFIHAGFLPGILMIFLGYFVSTITAQYLIEAMAAVNASQQSLLGSVDKEPYSFVRRVEYSGIMSNYLSRGLNILFYIVLLAYLFSVICVQAIETSINLSTMLSIIIYGATNQVNYHLMLAVFFFIVFLLSMKNIANVKLVSFLVILIKGLVIMIYLIGGIYTIIEYGAISVDQLYYVDYSYFPKLFGNVVMQFLIQHSVLGWVYPIRNEFHANRLVALSLGVSCCFIAVHNTLAMLSVAQIENVNWSKFPWQVQELYSINFASWSIFGLIVNLYPIGNIFAVVVKTITLRNNLMQYIVPRKISGDSNICDAYVLLFTALVVIPWFILSALVDDIQSLVMYTGGYSGVILMLIVPTLCIHNARRKYNSNTYENKHRSWFQNWAWEVLMYLIGAIFAATVTLNIFS